MTNPPPRLIALSQSQLILINDVNKLDYVALNKDLNLLFNSPNNLVLAGHDGVFQFDPSISNLSNLVLPVTVE